MASTFTAAPLALAAPDGSSHPQDKVEVSVQEAVADGAKSGFWVRFDERPDLAALSTIPDWNERGRAVHEALTETAESAQAGARTHLDRAGVVYDSYYATNAIHVRGADAGVVNAMALLPEVEGIYAERSYERPELEQVPEQFSPNAVEWGISDINAPQVWEDYGVRGEGIVVATIDTGVQWDHPALIGQYRGNVDGAITHDYSWFDATGMGFEEPVDMEGHGTHVTGTMVGDDGGDNQIGVAPGARWISAGVDWSDQALISSGEWMLAPTDLNGENPDPDLRPHIINNSWGSIFPSNDPFMVDISEAWAASGQMGIWANGNSGPGCETSGSPGSLPINYSVGNYDANHDINFTSGLGPGADGEIKPNISAPGTDVRSAIPGNGYGLASGTSMASPHVAGTVALLWSAGITIVGNLELTRSLLDGTAIDTEDLQCGGTAEKNNVFGEGRLDALALLDSAPLGPVGTVLGTVTDADSGEPLAGVNVALTGEEMSRMVRTGADGTFETRVAVGDYDVDVSKFGYVSSSTTVTVLEDQESVLNLALAPAAMGTITGTVTDASGQGWALYARIAVGTDASTYTDPETGAYTLELPVGTHTLRVTAQLPGYVVGEREVTVAADGSTVADFGLVVDVDSCSAPGYALNYDGIMEDFNAGELPTGWEIHDFSDGGPWTIGDPYGMPNNTGGDGLFAVVNSDFYGPEVLQDTVLVTPSVDLSGQASPVLEFKQEFLPIDALASVEVSLDGGEWTAIWESTTQASFTTVRLDVGDVVGDSTNARFRFHYVTFTWDWYWQVDDVFIGTRSCDPVGGGLITGYVVDDREGDPVLNAKVTSLENPSDAGTTRATPDDENLQDGFYLMHSVLTGNQPFETRAANFGASTQDIEVIAGQVVRADWVLSSAEVVIDPTAIETTVELGQADGDSLTITNTGTAAAELVLSEVSGGMDILRADGSTLSSQEVRGATGAPEVSASVTPIISATAPAGWSTASEPVAPGPLEEPWEELSALPSPLLDNRMVNWDGSWYTIGGSVDFMGPTDLVASYDPVAMEWTTHGPMPESVQQPAAQATGELIVVAGGWDAQGGVSSSTWLYDPADDSWSSGSPMPFAVSAAGQAVLDGQLYVIGGCTTANCEPMSDVVQVYDVAGDSWTVLDGAYPVQAAFPACGALDGQVVCAGGVNPQNDLQNTFAFDPGSQTWTSMADAPATVWAAASASAGDLLVVNGGIQNGDISNATHGYDLTADEWVSLPASNVAAYRAGAACGFVRAGGIDSNGEISARAEYLPGMEDCEGSGADVPWLELDVTELLLEPGDSATVTVTTDSAAVNQPGTYTAGVRVRGNLPVQPEPVEVTMQVTPPSTWGKIDGTGSFMMCDLLPIPIEGILVSAQPSSGAGAFLMSTNTDGYYARWVTDHIGEVRLTATLDGFHPESATIRPLRGTVVTTDFDLLNTDCEIDEGPYPVSVQRVAGANRYATAVEISQAYEPGVETVFLATGENFPDALTAASRAGSLEGPVLLTRSDHLPSWTRDELERLDPEQVIVVGGLSAVSQDVEDWAASLVPDAQLSRLAGTDRYATAALLSAQVESSEVVYIATGLNFPDALAGSAVAGAQDAPVLLVRQDRLPQATRAELERLSPERIVVLGGDEAISPQVEQALGEYGAVERIAGSDRFGTAAALAQSLQTSSDVYVATGADFPDALAGSARAAMTNSPVLLVREQTVPAVTWQEMVRLDPARILVLGGEEVISEQVISQLAGLR